MVVVHRGLDRPILSKSTLVLGQLHHRYQAGLFPIFASLSSCNDRQTRRSTLDCSEVQQLDILHFPVRVRQPIFRARLCSPHCSRKTVPISHEAMLTFDHRILKLRSYHRYRPPQPRTAAKRSARYGIFFFYRPLARSSWRTQLFRKWLTVIEALLFPTKTISP